MTDRRFGRQRRLLAREQFESVLRAPHVRMASGPFRLAARRNGVGFTRLGFVVAKRLIRHSVDRNRVKRCIRETFRLAMNDLPAVDVVVRLAAPLPDIRENLPRQPLNTLWRRLGAWGASP